MHATFARLREEAGREVGNDHQEDYTGGERESSFKFVDPKEYAKSFLSTKKEQATTKSNASNKKKHVKESNPEDETFLNNLIYNIKSQGQSLARGAAPIVDLATYPVRKAQEAITGRAPMTLSEFVSQGYEEPDFKKEPFKAALHKGLEWAGSTVPGAGVGSALMKAGQHIPKAGKYVSKVGDVLGGGAFNSSLAGKAAPLAEMTASSIPMGMAAETYNKSTGHEPIIGDILGSLAGGGIYGLARHPTHFPKKAKEFAGRLASGDIGRSVRQSYLLNLKNTIGEENVDALIEKIKGYKPVMKGHTPTVAEMTMPESHTDPMYPQIAILERANLLNPKVAAAKGETDTFINNRLEDLHNHGGTDIQDVRSGLQNAYDEDREAVQKVLDKLSPPHAGDAIPQDVGETLREQTKEHLDKGWKKRSLESDPHWDEVNKDLREVSPQPLRDFVAKSFKEGLGDKTSESAYKRIKNFVGKGSKNPSEAEIDAVLAKGKDRERSGFLPSDLDMQWPHMSEAEKNAVLKKAGIFQEGKKVTVSQIDKERRILKDAYQDAKNSKQHGRARDLKQLLEEVENYLFSVNDSAQTAIKKYAEHSGPINLIEEVPSNFQMVNESYGIPQVLDTTIGESFTRGSKAPEKVQKLVKAYQTMGDAGIPHIEAARESITSEAKNELMNTVINENGLVDLNKLNSFSNKMTGAQEIDKSFVKDLKSLSQAQKNLEKQFGRYEKGSKDKLLEGEPQRVVRELFNAKNQEQALGEVLERLERVGMKDGKEGILSGVLEHMQQTLRGTGDKRVITPHAYNTYMKKHGKMLKSLMPAEEYKMLQGIQKIMEQKKFTQASTHTPGSPTENLRQVNEKFNDEGRGLLRRLLRGGLHMIPGVGKTLKFLNSDLSKDVKTLKSEMLGKFLTDSEQALKDLHGTKNVSDKEIFDYAKGIMPRNILLYLLKDDEKNDFH